MVYCGTFDKRLERINGKTLCFKKKTGYLSEDFSNIFDKSHAIDITFKIV